MGAGQSRNRTGIILLLVVLVVLIGGAIAAVLLLGVLGGDPNVDGEETAVAEATETPTPTATPPVVDVIVAARDIPRGARLTLDDVQVITYPEDPNNPLPPSLLTVSDDSTLENQGLSQVEGRVARTDLITGQPIHEFMITPGEDPIDLAAVGGDAALKIPSGFVAMTIPMARVGMLDYLVREGDHVDIMASYRFLDVDTEFQSAYPNQGIYIGRTQPYEETDPIIRDDDGNIIGLTEGIEYQLPGGDYVSFPFGSGISGPRDFNEFPTYGSSPALYPSHLVIAPSEAQRPRQSTQLIIDNAIVLQVGLADFSDIYLPEVYEPQIVVTSVPTSAPTPTPPPAEGEGADQGQQQQQQQDEGTEEEATAVPPTATPLPAPITITLVMSRQDALVLKYSMETGANIDLALRSVLDDNITDVATDTVTLEYILDVYGVDIPNRLHVATDPRIDLLPFTEIFNFSLQEDSSSIDLFYGTLETGTTNQP